MRVYLVGPLCLGRLRQNRCILLNFAITGSFLLDFDTRADNINSVRMWSAGTSTATTFGSRSTSTNIPGGGRWLLLGDRSRPRRGRAGQRTEIAATGRGRTPARRGPISQSHPPAPPAGRNDPGGAGRRGCIARCHRPRRGEAGGRRCARAAGGTSSNSNAGSCSSPAGAGVLTRELRRRRRCIAPATSDSAAGGRGWLRWSHHQSSRPSTPPSGHALVC